jgi:AbiV family abortive infection protein
MSNKKLDTDPKLIAGMQACVAHARALLQSAQAVQSAGHPNVAYHLAALCLEEIGRRALFRVQSVAAKATVPPAWPKKHEQDHVKKLFWCFFGGSFLTDKLTADRLHEMTGLAQRIHDMRVKGLYVDAAEDSLSIPSEAIDKGEADTLIKLAEAGLGMAEAETFREEASQKDIDLQAWFLDAMDDPEKRKRILSNGSLTKLAELKDVRAWGLWLKVLFDTAAAEVRQAAQQELERSKNLPEAKTKDKWKLRVRIVCASHSIRPKVLTVWNERSSWIKLSAVSGRKNELFIYFILGDNVPVHALWYFGWGVARQFVVALNIATMGFWWWRMPEQISRWYESIHDIEKRGELALERSPSLKIDWGANRVLTDIDLGRTAAVFAAFPARDPKGEQTGLDHYIGGLTFLALNDVHWQCELQSFGNFFQSLREMMAQHGDWTRGTPFEPSFVRFIDELFSGMEKKARYADLVRAFDTEKLEGVTITLEEVSFIKLFTDAYFLHKLQSRATKELDERLKAEAPEHQVSEEPEHVGS